MLVLEFYKKSRGIYAETSARSIATRAFVTAAALTVAFLGMACLSGPSEELNSATVQGVILRVESLSLTELALLEIRDEAGKIWTFEARGKRFALFTPSHLNEHKVLGLKVRVSYHREGDALVIDDVSE